MSTAQKTAAEWVCDRCSVCVKQSDGKQTKLPDNWASSDDGRFCLICRRERAAEAALETAAENSHKERAGLRRAALLEFEVTRTPDRSNGEIARAVRTSVPAVAEARRRLDEAGQ